MFLKYPFRAKELVSLTTRTNLFHDRSSEKLEYICTEVRGSKFFETTNRSVWKHMLRVMLDLLYEVNQEAKFKIPPIHKYEVFSKLLLFLSFENIYIVLIHLFSI